jgi:6-phosphogluconolactonase
MIQILRSFQYRLICQRNWLEVILGAFVVLSASSATAGQSRVYIGSYTTGDSISEGIYTCLFNDDTGELSAPVLAAKTINPTFLAIHPSRPLLFSVGEVDDFEGKSQGSINVFRISGDSGELEFINQQPTEGAAPCHLSIDGTGKFVLVANYTGGNTVVFPIADNGSISERSCLIQHEGTGPNQQRQEKAHAHSVNLSTNNKFAYVADLGTDRIWVFEFDAEQGMLIPATPAFATVAAGGGPRHFDLSNDERFAWSNNELTSSVTAFTRDATTGQLTAVQELSTLPGDFEGQNSTAECRLHPNGRFVYVSNRGHDSIAAYSVGNDGQLTLLEIVKTGGKEPRNFYIVQNGKWLIAENQNSDSIIVFAVSEDGSLTPTQHSISVGRPVCIRQLGQN